jgi:hypothetical protein
MEEDLKKKFKKGRRPKKRKTNQSTKINLIGCDTIENSPSSSIVMAFFALAPVSFKYGAGKQLICYPN